MTEYEWLTSTDPASMLEYWRNEQLAEKRPISPDKDNRKLRLFACACWRLWGNTSNEDYAMVERAGHASDHWCMSPAALCRAWCNLTEHSTQKAILLRDILGNPWKPVTSVDLNWVQLSLYKQSKPYQIAQRAYDERVCERCGGEGDFGSPEFTPCPYCHGKGTIESDELDPVALLVLADALEEAGCEEQRCGTCKGRGAVGTIVCSECKGHAWHHPVLTHLRGPGPHVRGCWAVDLILGRE